ncbi:MAG TPA: hypothetical protein IGS52_11020 [Oscillatoriaceae cyanobacterium M33_DOE_052]|uniref:Uncharacterized protein n=1 Tax=Planktothricoides sp. SpSt-374 TaxID=2282167 RepID=A0A7C3VNV8_9CYAN|nr:hypothetical protein [Oscillatoriaceae cyanobacterium M33_DOE_052]
MTESLIWVNEDGINPEHKMFRDYPDAPRVYIFDVSYLQQWRISHHRLQFIYESLLEIPHISIYKGETVAVLDSLLQEYNVREVITTATPNHIITGWQDEILKQADLVTYPQIYPVQDSSSPRRFARYWRQSDRFWLTP